MSTLFIIIYFECMSKSLSLSFHSLYPFSEINMNVCPRFSYPGGTTFNRASKASLHFFSRHCSHCPQLCIELPYGRKIEDTEAVQQQWQRNDVATTRRSVVEGLASAAVMAAKMAATRSVASPMRWIRSRIVRRHLHPILPRHH